MITIIIATVISFWLDLSFTPCILVVLVIEFLAKRFLIPPPASTPKLTHVYVLSSGELNEGSSIDAIFSTKEKAEARALELVESRFNFGKNNKTQRVGNRWSRGVDFIEFDEFPIK